MPSQKRYHNQDREGAERLAAKIHQYWAQRGHRVRVYLDKERDPTMPDRHTLGVRSNLVGGMPTSKARARV